MLPVIAHGHAERLTRCMLTPWPPGSVGAARDLVPLLLHAPACWYADMRYLVAAVGHLRALVLNGRQRQVPTAACTPLPVMYAGYPITRRVRFVAPPSCADPR